MQSQNQSAFDIVTSICKSSWKDMWTEACQPALWKADTTGALKERFLANGWSTDSLCHLQKRNKWVNHIIHEQREAFILQVESERKDQKWKCWVIIYQIGRKQNQEHKCSFSDNYC